MKTAHIKRTAVLLILLVSAVTMARADDERAVSYLTQGVHKLLDNNYDGAIADYTSAIEIDPQYEAAYANRASAEYSQGNYAGAIADWETVIKLKPSLKTETQPFIDEARKKLHQQEN